MAWPWLAVGAGAAAALLLLALAALVYATRGFNQGGALPLAVGGKDLFAEMRDAAWLEMCRRWGLSFRYEGMVATAEPAVVRKLLKTKAHSQRRSVIYKCFGRFAPCCDGLLSQDGEIWQRHTRVLLAFFSGSNVEQYAAAMHAEADAAVDRWVRVCAPGGGGGATSSDGGGRSVDMSTEMNGMAARVLLRYAFGMDPDTPVGTELRTQLLLYLDIAWRQIDAQHLWRVWSLKRCADRIRKLVDRVLRERLYTHSGKENFLTAMVAAGFSAEEIANEVNQMHVAHKAIGFTLACSIFEAAKHPAWVRRMRQEWVCAGLRCTASREEDGAAAPKAAAARDVPSRDDFDKLPVTMAFFDEVTRTHPVSQGVARRTGEPLDVGGVVVPAGSEVLVLLHALHHHTDFWGPTAAVFDPSRWLAPSEHSGKHKAVPTDAFVPFLDGQRLCRGMYLARLEWTVFMHALFSRCDVEAPGLERIAIRDHMFTQIEGGVHCVVRPLPHTSAQ